MRQDYGQRVMLIQLGKPPIYYDNAKAAAEELGIADTSIKELACSGKSTKKGYCFDYALD